MATTPQPEVELAAAGDSRGVAEAAVTASRVQTPPSDQPPAVAREADPSALSSFARSVHSWLEYLGEHLADLFGLNDSKYQWAVDEHLARKRAKAERKALRRERREARAAAEAARMEGGGSLEEGDGDGDVGKQKGELQPDA
mmetsp:Transcript_12831/g.39945  ORF Transcript_12831/g.39945 Transcript_12831/m.39945 type:complete len:142 (-) Transcript_12831:6-431(-)